MSQRPLHGWLEELEPGATFESRGRTITEADIVGFGTLTGDLHPQHVDAEWSARSPFGERAAHSMLLVSFALGLLDLDEEMLVALRRIDDLVFKRPVAIGSTIHAEGRIESVREESDEHGLVELRLRILTGTSLVASASIHARWRRTPGHPDEQIELRAGRGRFERPASTEPETEPIPL